MPKRSTVNATDYHLIDLLTGQSHGGFVSLEAARVEARWERLLAWQIWRDNIKIEHHDPDGIAVGVKPVVAFPDKCA